jgi:GNAT superfamily N-acetyltransferase
VDPNASDDGVVIAPVGSDDYEAVLPLMADYQRFYGNDTPDDARNRSFFARFVGPNEEGRILAARRRGEIVGYACCAFAKSSIEPEDIVIMDDLYVVPGARGGGVGRRLIEATVALARERHVLRVRWSTALDNRRAQRLYEQMGAERSTWFEYEILVADHTPDR